VAVDALLRGRISVFDVVANPLRVGGADVGGGAREVEDGTDLDVGLRVGARRTFVALVVTTAGNAGDECETDW
jgi:hypothetical protein